MYFHPLLILVVAILWPISLGLMCYLTTRALESPDDDDETYDLARHDFTSYPDGGSNADERMDAYLDGLYSRRREDAMTTDPDYRQD